MTLPLATIGALDQADARMKRAKARFSLAALACLRNAPDAAQMVANALEEIEAARVALRQAIESGQDAQGDVDVPVVSASGAAHA